MNHCQLPFPETEISAGDYQPTRCHIHNSFQYYLGFNFMSHHDVARFRQELFEALITCFGDGVSGG